MLTRLGYGAECATWRNNYLTGAQELHGPISDTMVSSAGMAAALTVTQLFDSLAIRIIGKQAWDTTASIRWHFTDTGETYQMELSNGVLKWRDPEEHEGYDDQDCDSATEKHGPCAGHHVDMRCKQA